MGEYGYRPDIKGPSKWKALKNMAEIAGLAAILSFAAPESAPAQEKGGGIPEAKDKMVELKKLGNESMAKILGLLGVKGQEGTMGNTPIRRWTSPDQSRVEAGYGADKKTAKWVVIEGDNGSVRYVDVSGDGLVDRVIYNDMQGSIGRKRGENDLKSFTSMEELAGTAGTEADLDPQKIKVVEFSKSQNGETVLRMIDYATGEATELSGPRADKYLEGIQGGFVNGTQSIEADMGK